MLFSVVCVNFQEIGKRKEILKESCYVKLSVAWSIIAKLPANGMRKRMVVVVLLVVVVVLLLLLLLVMLTKVMISFM